MRSLALVSLCLPPFLLGSCAHTPPAVAPAPPPAPAHAPSPAPASVEPARPATPVQREQRAPSVPDLQAGDLLLQGYIGASFYDGTTASGGDLEFSEEPDFDTFPLIGGGGQWVFGGDQVDFGLEAGVGFGFRTAGGAFISSGGVTVVAVDVNLLLVDLYGGFFASTFLGSRWRLYGAAGPLMQFADYELQDQDESGSGFGVGYYGRAGLEYVLASRTMIGLGGRWLASEVDLSNDLGDLELEGTQVFLTVTTGL